jgi:hypothetical protein
MNGRQIPIKKGERIQYKEYLRKSGLGMIDITSGRVFDPRKLSNQKNSTIDFVLAPDSKKEGKSYLNLSKGEKARLVSHLENKRETVIYNKTFSKKMSDTYSLVNLKTKDSTDLLEFGGINNKPRNQVPSIYPNNFNFFLKNSTSTSNRTDINRV